MENNSFVILIPNQTSGSSTTTIYYINNNPEFQITWNAPNPVDGALTKYFVEYKKIFFSESTPYLEPRKLVLRWISHR